MRLGIGTLDRHLLGDSEVIALRLLPVDQPDGLGVLPNLRLDLHPIAQQLVHRLVAVIQAFAGVVRNPVQLEDGSAGQIGVHALLQ
ncbi:hypothetical protein D9M68_730200 [compost metagenome]